MARASVRSRAMKALPEIEADDGEIRSVDLSAEEAKQLQEIAWELGYGVWEDPKFLDAELIGTIVKRWAGYS